MGVKSLTSEARPFASMSHSDRFVCAGLDGAWRSATFSGVDQLFANLIGLRGSLRSLFIPKHCKSLPEQILNGFRSLSRVTFASGSVLRRIGSRAFSGCSQLREIEIPASVEVGDGIGLRVIRV